MNSLNYWCIVVLISSCLGCGNNKHDTNQLGAIDFQVTGGVEAQPHFENGLLLLHSFEYDDAKEAFLKAQALDPDFVMAYWGEAMACNRSFWKLQDYENGVSALTKLADSRQARIMKAQTQIEKDFIEAVDILYYSADDKQTRDTKYASFMGQLREKYPQNHEVATFYSLALLAAVPEGRDEDTYAKAADIAQSVLDQNQQHPGALHYLIHSYDDPQHAILALQAARGYAKVAPDAAHALHMPSHIYVALGMWDEVVSSNERSYQASLDRRERKQLDNDARGYHSFYWLMYGYLQQGRFQEAEKIVKDMITYTNELPSTRARVYLEMMKGTFGIESNKWEIEWPGAEQKTEDLNIIFQTIPLFMQGLAAYKASNSAGLESLLVKMADAREQAGNQLINKSLTVCGSVPLAKPDQIDVDQATVLEWELYALQAWLDSDTTKTHDWFRKAVNLESKISYSFGPPIIVKPSNELYGEWLLEIDQPVEAANQFELALERAPKRVLSLKGKAEAARRSGDQVLANKVEGELKTITKNNNLGASL